MSLNALHLFAIILACSHLIASNAMAMPRDRQVFHESQEIVASENMKQISEEATKDDFIEGRMDFHVNDYAPTGANPYHTPKLPHV
ncbi:hypothetical protein Nepgr_003572 [Nepenthes gracilis]|uniref:Uncharacterized protein n=1 Tax=Nepenthes gracilis TaxID=150966 RepID=A0AAD3RZR6_NEPGR|nr:hypothetical protein Nepgr_003572 [Nepenthes gracilis]